MSHCASCHAPSVTALRDFTRPADCCAEWLALLETLWQTRLGGAAVAVHVARMNQAASPVIDGCERLTVREPQDWEACEPRSFVRHKPSQCIFELYVHPGKPPEAFLELADFRVRLAHVCDGYPYPAPDEYRCLCREAVLMALHFIGYVQLVDAGPGNDGMFLE
jgi:hypothetical protein